MSQPEGRALVAAYLKQLRIERGVDQDAIAERIGVHRNTVIAHESPAAAPRDRLETAITICRLLGGDVSHVTNLRAGILPPGYPRERMGRGEEATVEVAADLASWHIAEQDRRLAEAAHRKGVNIEGLNDLLTALRFEAFQKPDRALKVYLQPR